jgi:hypothetical protein
MLMRSARLAKAITRGTVFVRNNRTGQVILKFRSQGAKDRIFPPVPLQDLNNKESFINMSRFYSADQLKASTLEDLILTEDLELGNF